MPSNEPEMKLIIKVSYHFEILCAVLYLNRHQDPKICFRSAISLENQRFIGPGSNKLMSYRIAWTRIFDISVQKIMERGKSPTSQVSLRFKESSIFVLLSSDMQGT